MDEISFFVPYKKAVNDFLVQTFEPHLKVAQTNLVPAMTYSLYNGGKRLRATLVYILGEYYGTPFSILNPLAAAVEVFHTFSLIHDDLPCMDNSDLRRGHPTCHKKFGEAIALLAGDALQTFGFDLILSSPLMDVLKVWCLHKSTRALGIYGLEEGQALDIATFGHGHDSTMSTQLLDKMYHLKTTPLFDLSLAFGALRDDPLLTRFAHHLGLAFQIYDDILEEEETEDVIGKQKGLDEIHDKGTYPHLVGLDKAKQTFNTHYQTLMHITRDLGCAPLETCLTTLFKGGF